MPTDSAARKAADRTVSTGGDENAPRDRNGSVNRKTEARAGRARHVEDGRPRARRAGPPAAHACNGLDKVTGETRLPRDRSAPKDDERTLAATVPGHDHGLYWVPPFAVGDFDGS